MIEEKDIPSGVGSMQVYLVRYDEDQWLRYTAEDHQFCYDWWIKRAKPLGCRHLVVQLVPNPVFPRDPEKQFPYNYYQQVIEREEVKGFECSASVIINLNEGIQKIDVPLRARIERVLAMYPNGTKYEVRTSVERGGETGQEYEGYTVLLQGKVNK